MLGAVVSAAGIGARAGEQWPRFRGPSGQGVTSDTRLPLTWDAGSGIRWQADIPGDGWSSPIVWEDTVFLTTATDGGASARVLAFDRRTGGMRWNTEVFRQALRRKEAKNSYATPTPTTDGRRVYAGFGDGSFAALNFDGTIAWVNRELSFYGQHGLGTSLVLHENLLIMARDGSSSGPDLKVGWQMPWTESFIVALERATGRVRWRAARGSSRIAHATPFIARVRGRSVLLSPAGDVIQAFDPGSGKRLWSVESHGEAVVPSPVLAGPVVVTASGFGRPAVRAVSLEPEPQVAWEQAKGVPMQASPVYVKPYVYVVTDGGVLSALHEASGAIGWQQRINGTFSASPLAAADRMYWLNEECETLVIRPGPAFVELARNQLPGRCQASMAVASGDLFIRTDRRLYAIRAQP